MNGNKPEGYSRLQSVLAGMNMTVFQLHRRLEEAGFSVNIKSLYRLATEEPIRKIDLGIAAALCRICNVALGELITLEKPRPQLRRLDARTQARLEELMSKNNDGKLTSAEKREFAQLAEKAHRLSLDNARALQAGRKRAGQSRTRATKGREALAA
jgi:hypothetical protein